MPELFPLIALYGVCQKTTWRHPIIARLKELDIDYYNPQLEPGVWTPAHAELEAVNLDRAETILVAITDETYGFGSLAEVFVAVSKVIGNPKRALAIYVAPRCHESLDRDIPAEKVTESFTRHAFDASNRTRALVLAHLKQIRQPNICVASSLEIAVNACLIHYGNQNTDKQYVFPSNG